MFEKILSPVDGSKNSTRALTVAIGIAQKFGANITLIHVYSVTDCMHAGIYFDKCVQELQKIGTKILTKHEKKVKAEGVNAEKLLKKGHAVEEILKTARNGEYDSIVIGARGVSQIKELLFGSVSTGVIRHAQCPVVVVK